MNHLFADLAGGQGFFQFVIAEAKARRHLDIEPRVERRRCRAHAEEPVRLDEAEKAPVAAQDLVQ